MNRIYKKFPGPSIQSYRTTCYEQTTNLTVKKGFKRRAYEQKWLIVKILKYVLKCGTALTKICYFVLHYAFFRNAVFLSEKWHVYGILQHVWSIC